GHDVVTAELFDRVAADCEVVSRQLSRDTLTDEPAQHETQVEPSSAASGGTIVTVFQSGRHLGGGAAGIGFATSRDAGATWRSGSCTGTCSVTHRDSARGAISTRRSHDGGLTWSAPVAVRAGEGSSGIMNGPQPVVRPDGGVIIPFSIFAALDGSDEIGVLRSTDGGITFGPPARISRLVNEEVVGMRAPAFPSAAVDAGGRVYAAWSDARFREDASADDIVLATSRDGLTWSQPAVVPIEEPGSTTDLFVPALAVDPS